MRFLRRAGGGSIFDTVSGHYYRRGPMGQRSNRLPTRACVALLVWGLLATLAAACSRPAPPPATGPTGKTVASLVPAATDLLIGMGAADRIVAVSTFDTDPAVAGLPRVGDYQTVDWEQLAALRPAVMVVQYGADRVPPGLMSRAAGLGILVVNVKFERLEDVFQQVGRLGEAADLKVGALRYADRLRAQLDAVRARVAGRAAVSTLLTLDAKAKLSAGPGTYLDDVLTVAGGRNVLGESRAGYPQIDRETLLALRPAAVVQLMPAAPPQSLAEASKTWSQLPTLPAVRDGRIYPMTDPWVLLPGAHVGDLAEQMAAALHPEAATRRSEN